METVTLNNEGRGLGICLQVLGPRYGHSWMALIDADEFLILTDPGATTMPALLREYEAYGGLGVNWRVFGSSGHIDKPEGGTLANFVTCIPQVRAPRHRRDLCALQH